MSKDHENKWRYLENWRKALDTTGSEMADGASLADRGDRAVLRRCRSIDEVLLTPVYYDVRTSLQKNGFDVTQSRFRGWDGEENGDRRLAAVVGLMAWIEEDDETISFARQLGRRRPDSEDAMLTGLRFRRLLEAPDRDQLYELMRAVVDLLGRRANVKDFANDIFFWSPEAKNRVRQRWAEGYYTAAPTEL